jgi:hypothetical protein
VQARSDARSASTSRVYLDVGPIADAAPRSCDPFQPAGPVYLERMAQPAPTLRDTNLDKLATLRFDVLVLGGGINGAVSAAALAARGACGIDRPR